MILTQEEVDKYLAQEPYILKGRARDLSNKQFNRLIAIKPIGKIGKDSCIIWLCLCECGNYITVRGSHLSDKTIQSCGCWNKQVSRNKIIAKSNNSLGEKFPELIQYWSDKNTKIDGTPLTIFDINYGSGIKRLWKCNNGYTHDYLCRPSDKIQGCKCGICDGKQIASGFNDLLTTHPELCKEWDYESAYNQQLKRGNSPQFYSKGCNTKVDWSCIICGHKWKATINNRTNNNRGCPQCNESKGEKEVRKILDSLSIRYEREKSYPDLCGIGNGLLRFDFYLPDYNTLIEFQGQQHYNELGWYDEESRKITQSHDKTKRQYCKNNKVPLIVIHHKDFDKIELIISNIVNKYMECDVNEDNL